VSKKRYDSCLPNGRLQKNFWRKADNVLLRETTRAVLEIWGRMYNVLPHSAKAEGTRNGTRNRIPVQPRKGAIKLVSGDYAKILE
jgi:hypothetical protein